MGTTRMDKTNSNKVKHKMAVKVKKANNPTNNKVSSWTTKTRTVKTIMMEMEYQMIWIQMMTMIVYRTA